MAYSSRARYLAKRVDHDLVSDRWLHMLRALEQGAANHPRIGRTPLVLLSSAARVVIVPGAGSFAPAELDRGHFW